MEGLYSARCNRASQRSATDMKAVMEARGAIVEAMDDNALGDTMTDICGKHSDYMWDITSQNP